MRKSIVLAPDKELEFTIDLIFESALIIQIPYRMAPSELKELKVQLQGFVDRVFIRFNTLSWGASIFLVKKRMDPYELCIDYR